MWIFTEFGFLSVVQDERDPLRLLVRARCEADLQSFVRTMEPTAGEPLEPAHTPDADYAYRVSISRQAFARYMRAVVEAIDYPNFKGRVHERDPDPLRTDAYFSTWQAMRRLQQRSALRELASEAPAEDRERVLRGGR